mmetsp:Transcript_785/g.2135  ORF Transcript_785/g.2135 Transcript_785/m.2135 type:complete len:128 (-) Transcript_785:2626-3009(-)
MAFVTAGSALGLRRVCAASRGSCERKRGGGSGACGARRAAQLTMEMYEDPGKGRPNNDPLAPIPGKKKTFSKAAASQGMTFLDAWTLKQGGNKIDIWVIIAALTILVPVGGLVIGLVSGVIPGLYNN